MLPHFLLWFAYNTNIIIGATANNSRCSDVTKEWNLPKGSQPVRCGVEHIIYVVKVVNGMAAFVVIT